MRSRGSEHRGKEAELPLGHDGGGTSNRQWKMRVEGGLFSRPLRESILDGERRISKLSLSHYRCLFPGSHPPHSSPSA